MPLLMCVVRWVEGFWCICYSIKKCVAPSIKCITFKPTNETFIFKFEFRCCNILKAMILSWWKMLGFFFFVPLLNVFFFCHWNPLEGRRGYWGTWNNWTWWGGQWNPYRDRLLINYYCTAAVISIPQSDIQMMCIDFHSPLMRAVRWVNSQSKSFRRRQGRYYRAQMLPSLASWRPGLRWILGKRLLSHHSVFCVFWIC